MLILGVFFDYNCFYFLRQDFLMNLKLIELEKFGMDFQDLIVYVFFGNLGLKVYVNVFGFYFGFGYLNLGLSIFIVSILFIDLLFQLFEFFFKEEDIQIIICF